MNLTTKETANRLRISSQTLANWRVTGAGPAFIKAGSRVLYPLAQLEAWEASRTFQSTAAIPGGNHVG